MRKIATICLLLIACTVLIAQEQRRLMIINNLFFDKMPKQKPTAMIIYGTLKDSIWGNVPVMGYQNELSEETKQLAIPIEYIENGQELLKQAISKKELRNRAFPSGGLKVDIGDTFPAFSLTDIKGNKWDEKKFSGKKVVINFWYTGCGPCIREMPELGTWVTQYPDVLFVAITFENPEKIQKIITNKKFHFHQLVNADKLLKQVGIREYPLTIVLNEESKIIHIESGTSPTQRANILKALK